MSTSITATSEVVQAHATLLCVDDEPNILSALRRLLRAQGYRMFTAESGSAGLRILESESVDLVISDMRMPEMDGACFLEHVRRRWPDTIRLLLTGYADVQSIIGAINRGEIYRYITKPWLDGDMILVVRHALERRELERDKQRLEALTRRQNEELKALNANLEAKVAERTEETRQAHEEVLAANERLRSTFLTSIKVFSNLIELRLGHLGGHSRRAADLARRIAVKMKLKDREAQNIFVAGLLQDIGKVGFPDELLSIPADTLGGDKLDHYRRYPVRSEQLLMPLEDLSGAARIIRSRLERFDGKGFPDGLRDEDIPLGSRILAIASDYDNLQIGMLIKRRVAPEEARNMIVQAAGKRYDPRVARAFQEVIDETKQHAEAEMPIATMGLRPGMVLARDLVSADGVLLLSMDHILNPRLIRQIVDFEASINARLVVWIRKEQSAQ